MPTMLACSPWEKSWYSKTKNSNEIAHWIWLSSYLSAKIARSRHPPHTGRQPLQIILVVKDMR